MLSSLVLAAALVSQCPGGSCAMPARFSFQPSFSQAYAPDVNGHVTPPQLYRLADASGQAFDHADPVYLQSWIAGRNAAIASARRVAAAKSPPKACDTACTKPATPPAPKDPKHAVEPSKPMIGMAPPCACALVGGSCPCK